jgi:hypothetical protein
MFDSGISVKKIIDELITEVDIALEIPNATYVQWLNSLQQLLYTEVIKEQRKIAFTKNIQSPMSISSDDVETNENIPRFEDIHTIFANGTQLTKSTLTSGAILRDSFYKENNKIGFHTKKTPTELTIVYYVKPALVEVGDDDEIIDANVMLPIEFIDLVKAKLRGEAYKLANEDNLAAKWLNDYNILLEAFKVWIADKSPTFGM